MQAEQRQPVTRKLDPGKLLGFRNLAPQTSQDKDVRRDCGLTFNKIGGGETPA